MQEIVASMKRKVAHDRFGLAHRAALPRRRRM
jgi:hypothetical protein